MTRVIKLPEISVEAEWVGDNLRVDAWAMLPSGECLVYREPAFAHHPGKVRDQIEKAQIERALRGLINHLTSNKDLHDR